MKCKKILSIIFLCLFFGIFVSCSNQNVEMTLTAPVHTNAQTTSIPSVSITAEITKEEIFSAVTPTLEVTPAQTKKEITEKEFKNRWFGLQEKELEYFNEFFGVEGYYVPNYHNEYEWKLSDGKYVYVQFIINGRTGEEFGTTYAIEDFSVKENAYLFHNGREVKKEDCLKIKEGMTYNEVISILGEYSCYSGLASGYSLVEWEVDNGEYFICTFSKFFEDDLPKSHTVYDGTFFEYSHKSREYIKRIIKG